MRRLSYTTSMRRLSYTTSMRRHSYTTSCVLLRMLFVAGCRPHNPCVDALSSDEARTGDGPASIEAVLRERVERLCRKLVWSPAVENARPLVNLTAGYSGI